MCVIVLYFFILRGRYGRGYSCVAGPNNRLGHRSFLEKVQHQELNVLRQRPPAELVALDPQWVPQVICRLFSVFIRYTFRYIMY